MKKAILSVAAAGIWITVSEFVRNEYLFKNLWVDHFSSLGLRFETLPVNGILWMMWGFTLAFVIFKLLQKFSFQEAILLSWLAAFVMMWITIFNLQVFPLKLLMAVVPLSLIEAAVAGFIIRKIG
jgi:hypothetical protein